MIDHNKRILDKRRDEAFIMEADDLVNPLRMALGFVLGALLIVTVYHLYLSYKSAMEVQEAFIACIKGEGVQGVNDGELVYCWSSPIMGNKLQRKN